MFKDSALKYHKDLAANDQQIIDRWSYFAFEEVPSALDLEDSTRCMAILAVLVGVQGQDEFRRMAFTALENGVSADQLKEIVYQATAYLGMGRVAPFYSIVNEVLKEKGIHVEDDRAQTTLGDRLEKGNAIQIAYFGPAMKETWKKGGERAKVNEWLASNCFGDYYARKGLSDAQREMITFCFIYAQGGCESQLRAHTNGNLRVGNPRSQLVEIVYQCIPFVGYPRSLNALAIIEEVCGQKEE